MSDLLTGIRDVDIKILNTITDEELLMLCGYPEFKDICDNEELWKQRIITRIDQDALQFNNNISWQDYYFQLSDYIPFDNASIKVAIEEGNLPIIKFIISRGITPTLREMSGAVKNGHIDILNFFEQNLSWTGKGSAGLALLSDQIDVLDWLEQRNIYPDQESIDLAVHTSYYDTLRWILDRDFPLRQSDINYIVMRNNPYILDLLEEYGYLPDQEGADLALKNNKKRSLDWLAARNIYPNINNNRVINVVLMNPKPEGLIWLLDNGLQPSQEQISRVVNRIPTRIANILESHNLL